MLTFVNTNMSLCGITVPAHPLDTELPKTPLS